MICGSQAGYFHLYENIDGNLSGNFTHVDSTFLGNRYGERTSIAISDINGDDFPDAVVGNYAGGLNYFDGVFATQIRNLGNELKTFYLFPNPGKDQLFIRSENGNIRSVVIYDLQGRIVATYKMNASQVEVSAAGMAKGIFMVQIVSDKTAEVIRWVHQ